MRSDDIRKDGKRSLQGKKSASSYQLVRSRLRGRKDKPIAVEHLEGIGERVSSF